MPERKGRRDFRYRENIKTAVESSTTIAEFMVEYGLPGILGGWLYFSLPPAYINQLDVDALNQAIRDGYVLEGRSLPELLKVYHPISDVVTNIDLGKLVSGGLISLLKGEVVRTESNIVKAIRIDYMNRFLALALPLNVTFATLYQGILGTIAAPITVVLAGLVNLFEVKLELIELVARKPDIPAIPPGNAAECDAEYKRCLAACGSGAGSRECRELCAEARNRCLNGTPGQKGAVRSFSFGTYRIAWHDRLVLAALEPTILITLRKSLGEAAA